MAVESKAEKFEQVSLALFQLLATQPLVKITHAKVARKANVSRAWIYKYIGSDKDALITFAIEHLGKKLTERDLADVIESKGDLIAATIAGVDRMFENTSTYPWFIPVYFKYKGTSSSPAQAIRDIEQAYVKRQATLMKRVFKSYNQKQAEAAAEVLTTLRMGLAFNWQMGELKSRGSREEILAFIGQWIGELFGT